MKFILFCLLAFSAKTLFAQAGSEIFLFDIKTEGNQIIISNGINITNHKGYDNQPSFHPAKPIIYYSSFNDSGRSDIKFYNYQTGKSANLTETNEREYSPTVTPDEKFISCIIQRDNGVQDLGKYPIGGGKAEVLIDNLKIGYHAWASKDKLMLFVLGDSINTLHFYNLAKKTDDELAQKIGRSLHKIPGEEAMSFVQNMPGNEKHIMKYDLASGAITLLANTIPGKEDLTWLNRNTILMADGNGVYFYDLNTKEGWVPLFIEGDASMLKGITRLAANSNQTKLAVVVSE